MLLEDFWDGFVLLAIFSPHKVNLKILSIPASDKLESRVSRRWLKAAGFIKSSFEIPACRKPDLANLGKSSSGIWPFPHKSSSGIWPFSVVSYLLGFGQSQQVIFRDC